MNAAANAATSAGVAGALVTVVNWLLGLAALPVMPTEVQTAVAVLLTAGVGYYLHLRGDPALGLFLGRRKDGAPPPDPVP